MGRMLGATAWGVVGRSDRPHPSRGTMGCGGLVPGEFLGVGRPGRRRARVGLPVRMSDLAERTRYVPSEVEPRLFARWFDAGIHHPEPEGDASENYSIA